MEKPNLVMLVGLPASGKSTLAKEYKSKGYIIHSSGAIREELGGDVNNQDINTQVFTLLHNRIKDYLKEGYSCVYDATNISYKRRKAFLEQIKNVDCNKICVFVATPYEVCLEQNQAQGRKVPDSVIKRMYCTIDVPYWYEGWDQIDIYYPQDSYKAGYKHWTQFLLDTEKVEQDNKYHNETLGNHCRSCANYVIKNYNLGHSFNLTSLTTAAALHDCGKPFCKTFVNTKGETTENAHYYYHEHVGSYNSLFYEVDYVDNESKLYVAALIRWHMQMHFIDKEPHLEKKYRNLLGDKFYKDLTLLHNGDKEAH